jgi:nicotinamidase-related amidase
MNIDKSVLIVVDMQNGFVRSRSQHIVPAVQEVIEHWEAFNGDVVFTRFINYPKSPYERLIHWTRMQQPPEIDIIPELQPYADRALKIIDKPIYSLFTDRGESFIREHGWEEFYICGIATESCVLKTATDAFERDLTPWIIQDACASHAGEEAHQAGLLVASRFIGKEQLITKDEVYRRF